MIVVFCARHKQNGDLRIVGFYRNATVFRERKISKLPDQTSNTYFISKDAVLIRESDRHVTIPTGKGGFGRTLWYGLNEEEHSSLREDVLNYVQDPTTLPESNHGVIEYRQRQCHERWECRGNVRRFIHEKGFRCEACHYTISDEDQQTWGSGFELHHLQPWSDLPEGEERSLVADDFAVLCATCHRAIHQSKYVSDVARFRKKVLAKRR